MESADRWSRRRFVGAALDAAAATVILGTIAADAACAAPALATLTYFDPRFAQARQRALKMPGATRLTATQGDPTTAALRCLASAQASASAPATGLLRLQGVTTESVPFCLQQLLPGSRLQQRRLDRDLFAWTFEERS